MTPDERARMAHLRGVWDDGQADYPSVLELIRLLLDAGRMDDVAEIAWAVKSQLDGEAAVAEFLGHVLPGLPRDHPAYPYLSGTPVEAAPSDGLDLSVDLVALARHLTTSDAPSPPSSG